MTLSALLLALVAALAPAAPAAAQDYPVRPVTLVVPFPPGGGVDVMARIVAEKLSSALGQQVVVDNRVGAGGVVGTRLVARAAPDGYTLLLGHSGTMAINPTLYKNAGYDPRKDFAPIGLIATMPVALLAHPRFAPKTVAEVIAYAKQNPGRLSFGTSAVGTGSYMTAELFKAAAGLDMTLIPYRGTAPLMNDLLGGHVPVAFGVLPQAMSNLESGALRAIAVTGAKRFSLLPDVPTVAESGLPGFEAVLYYGLLAPAGTPKPIVERLNAELNRAVSTEAVKSRINAEGGDATTGTPEEHAATLDRDETKWGALVKKLGLKVE
ncbi:MAG TPA: tripartite tricarboxylate transporter substrate binding protein [Xanthobacteraceae bacterium]|nr:tripartite tricarboxylate transporter substrate binding protein [Xanthobacteraceae bacterium]